MKEKKAKSQELFALMFEFGRTLKSEIAREDAPIPSMLHAETLRFIEEHQQPTMRELAVYLKVTPPTVTALVDSFVESGIVERVMDPEDRRRVRLALSKKGTQLLHDFKKCRTEAFARVLAPLSEADREELVRILSIVTSSHKH